MKIAHLFNKTLILAGVLGSGLNSAGSMAQDDSIPSIVPTPVSKVFIPAGFDDNDNVQAVIQGYFPSSCYRVGTSSVTVDQQTNTVAIQAHAYRYQGQLCLQALTPFIQEVKIGFLRQGKYRVIVNGDDQTAVNLTIGRSLTSSPDDHLYAPVEIADLISDPSRGSQYLLLQGSFPFMFMGCAVIKEVRTYTDPADVLVVLPVMEIKTGSGECEGYRHDFKYYHPLPEKFMGNGLLHVRVLNGEALNRFIQRVPE